MEVHSQFINCSNLTIAALKRANIISVTFSSASLLFLLLFLIFLLRYRAYRTTLQRLFLYFTFATALDAMVSILDIELQFDVDHKSRFCEWVGFGDVWATIEIELFYFCFMVCLITTVCEKIRAKQLHCCLAGGRKCRVLAEVLCIVGIVLIPLSYLWVPQYHNTYGLDGSTCWLKRFDKNCSMIRHYDVDFTTIGTINIALHVIVFLTFIVLIVILSMLIVKLRKSKDEGIGTVVRAIILIIVLSISMCIRMAQFGINVGVNFFSINVNESLNEVIANAGNAAANLMVSLGFAIYLYSPRSLAKEARKWICCKCWCCSKTKRNQHRAEPLIGTATIDEDGLGCVKTSIVRNDPSYTTSISAPYTNEFTDVVSHTPESQMRSKYGSINT